MQQFLHVGCGPRYKERTTLGFNRPDWKEIRYDINPLTNPDIVGDVLDLKQVETNSMQAVFSSHNIEHLYPHQVPICLREFHRVLLPYGHLVIVCPNLQKVAKYIAQGQLTTPLYISNTGPISALDILYGHIESVKSGNEYMSHKTGFIKESLLQEVKDAGFESAVAIARPAPYFDLWMVAVKSKVNRAVLRHLAREHFPS